MAVIIIEIVLFYIHAKIKGTYLHCRIDIIDYCRKRDDDDDGDDDDDDDDDDDYDDYDVNVSKCFDNNFSHNDCDSDNSCQRYEQLDNNNIINNTNNNNNKQL